LPYRIEWLVNNRVLFIEVTDQIAVEEREQFYKEVRANALNVSEKVHIIADINKQTQRIPISEAARMAILHPMPRSIDWVIAVGYFGPGNTLFNRLISAFFGVQLATATTKRKAISFLRERDPDIDWENADYSILGSLEEESDEGEKGGLSQE